MAHAVLALTFEDAVEEAQAYVKLNSLDEATLRDIADDYLVDLEKLRKAIDYG